MNKNYLAGLALFALTHSMAVQATQAEQCLSVAQAEALVTYLLPTVIDASRNKCSGSLPATASLMQKNSEQLSKYRTASESAWPEAKGAVTVLAGEKLPPEIDDALLRPIAEAMFSKLIGDGIKPKDCGTIDKIYSDLEPMPSSNLASLAITIVQAATKDDKKRNIPICKTPA